MEYIYLNNGIKMPILGFGTYFPNILDAEEAVYLALKSGYRHLDTAKWYVNEDKVANAIKRSGIKREELFITSKVESKGYNDTINDVYDTLNKLQTDYIDLILIHWPANDILETYKALEYLYEKNIVRAIGLSNFNQELCEYIIHNCKIKPQVNQIETHIYFQEKKMYNYLKSVNICHEGWSPFAENLLDVFNNPLILELSNKYNKKSSQVMLKFMIQKGIVVIPRSKNKEHIEENIDVFDFKISDEDMIKIENLDRKKQLSDWPTVMKCETNY